MAMALRLTRGVENKGDLVTSNDSVAVVGSNQLDGWVQDVFLINAMKEYSSEFLIASKMPANQMKDSTFTVICVSDDTTITIWINFGSGYVVWQSLTLNRLETFTFSEQSDPTGMKIVINKPVGVQSGSSQDTIVTGMNGGDHMCISLPPSSRLSLDHFITPIAIRNNQGGYHVRVIAAHANSVVSDLLGINAELATLRGGMYYELGPVTSGLMVRALWCSKPCLVVQYNMGPACDGTVYTDTFLMRVPSIDCAVVDRVIVTTIIPTRQWSVNWILSHGPRCHLQSVSMVWVLVDGWHFQMIPPWFTRPRALTMANMRSGLKEKTLALLHGCTATDLVRWKHMGHR